MELLVLCAKLIPDNEIKVAKRKMSGLQKKILRVVCELYQNTCAEYVKQRKDFAISNATEQRTFLVSPPGGREMKKGWIGLSWRWLSIADVAEEKFLTPTENEFLKHTSHPSMGVYWSRGPRSVLKRLLQDEESRSAAWRAVVSLEKRDLLLVQAQGRSDDLKTPLGEISHVTLHPLGYAVFLREAAM